MNFTVILILTGLCAIAPSSKDNSIGIYLVDADLSGGTSQRVCGYEMKMKHYPFLLFEMRNFAENTTDGVTSKEECTICDKVFTNLEGDVIGRIPLDGYEISFSEPSKAKGPDLGSKLSDTVKPQEATKNKRSFTWVARLNELEKGEGLQKLNEDCKKNPPADNCNVAARAVLNSGSFYSDRLGRGKNKKLAVWEFTSYGDRKKSPQGLADRVEIELGEFEKLPFEIELRKWGSDEKIFLRLEPTRDEDPIRIGLSNLPPASTYQPKILGPLKHFAWFYTLSAAYNGTPSDLMNCPIPDSIANDTLSPETAAPPSGSSEFCPLTRF